MEEEEDVNLELNATEIILITSYKELEMVKASWGNRTSTDDQKKI